MRARRRVTPFIVKAVMLEMQSAMQQAQGRRKEWNPTCRSET